MSRAKVHRVKTFLVTPSEAFGVGAEQSFAPAARGSAPTTCRPLDTTRGFPRPRRGTRGPRRAPPDRSAGRMASGGSALSPRSLSRTAGRPRRGRSGSHSLGMPAACTVFFNAPATTDSYTAQYTLPLHDALPILPAVVQATKTG